MNDQHLIEALMARYFEGLYQGDVTLLAEVLHPQAIYATASGGQLLPVTAMVRAQCSIPGRTFIDLLTLVKVDQRWQIISKVFDFTEVAEGTQPDARRPS